MTIDTWHDFKTMVLLKEPDIILNKGLSEDEIQSYLDFINNHHIPDELIEILYDSNGQCHNSNPVFLEFWNGILASDLFFHHYNFMSLNDVKEAYKFIQTYSKGKIDTNLIPFAEINSMKRDKGTTVFSIHNFDKTIYKIFCFIDDRGYVPVLEFSSEKFAKNLNEFLENQILWRNIGNGLDL
jgi:hypothetical protein